MKTIIILSILITSFVMAHDISNDCYTRLINKDVPADIALLSCEDITYGELKCIETNVTYNVATSIYSKDVICEGMTKKSANCYLKKIKSDNLADPMISATDCIEL